MNDADTPPFGPPRGMRDFYPEDMALRNALFQAWTEAARAYGFEPYDACVVEHLALLKRKGGEEIAEQLYTFTDKSGRELALRAEITPSLARMVAARQTQLTFPLKWFTIGQCFRYERMSRGRKREHYQWNLDILGASDVGAEVEVIATAIHALRTLGLGPSDVLVRVNSRGLLADLFARAAIPQERHGSLFLALDKRGKIDDTAIADMLLGEGFDRSAVETAFSLMNLSSLDEAAARLGEETPSLATLKRLFDLARLYGIAESVVFDVGIIRGLGYYTGPVFECFDVERRFRALFGGGRYDNLLAALGGRPLPAVGLGFGDVVVSELLADRHLRPRADDPALIHIGFFGESQRPAAIRLAMRWRVEGRRVELALSPEKAKSFFGRVGRSPAGQAIYLGPDDLARGTFRMKDLATRTETEHPLPAS